MLERIKTLLGINDELQDEVIEIIVENVTSTLKAKLGKEIPKELNFIIEEISIRRFNGLGSEGFKYEWAEGHKIEFYDLDDEFKPYEDIIEQHKDVTSSKGEVLFF